MSVIGSRKGLNFASSRMARLSLAAALMACLFLPKAALGQDEAEAAHGGHEEHGNHEYHKNGVFLFLGGTTESISDDPTTSFTLGLEYERRFSQLVGVAVGAEAVLGGEGREALAGLLLILHPVGRLGLAAGPGMELGKEHHTDHGEEGGGDTAVHAALRVGALYDFELGSRYTIAPAVFVDFIDGKDPALVWGAELGLGF